MKERNRVNDLYGRKKSGASRFSTRALSYSDRGARASHPSGPRRDSTDETRSTNVSIDQDSSFRGF